MEEMTMTVTAVTYLPEKDVHGAMTVKLPFVLTVLKAILSHC